MNGEKIDLSELGRGAGAAAGGDARSAAVTAPRSRWKTRVLLPTAVLGAAAAMLGYSAREALSPAIGVRVAPVLVRQLEGGAQADNAPGGAGGGVIVQAPGWVEADPFVINVAALAGGVVREVLVLEGERVEAGQVVARLIDDDARLALAGAEAELLGREGEIAAANAELHAAQTQWEHPFERHRAVNTSEAMVAEIRAELVMLDSQIEAEAARAQELREEYQRLSALRESRALAEGDLVRWEQRLRAQEGVLAAAHAKRAVLESQLARQEAELAAARSGLELRIEELRSLQLAEAAVMRARAVRDKARVMRDEAKLQLERMEVMSPAPGIVLSRMIEPGTRLMTRDDMTGSLALRLYDPARLQVRVDVPLADAMRVGVGHEAEIVTEAMPDRVFRGRVSRLVHEANIQKNTVQVKVAVDAEEGEFVLKPEMLTRVRFVGRGGQLRGSAAAGEAPSGHSLLVPRAALSEVKGDRARVWVIDELRRAATVRDVRIGWGGGGRDDWVEVREGLRPGDRVILERPANLRDGSRVEVMADGGAR